MTAWAVTSPLYPRLSLRLYVAALSSMEGTGLLKCCLQVVDKHILAEDPISIEWLTQEALDGWIALNKADGWTFAPWADAPIADPNDPRKCTRCSNLTDGTTKICAECHQRMNANKSRLRARQRARRGTDFMLPAKSEERNLEHQ